MSSASRLSQVRSARPPARWARTRLVLSEPGLGAGADREVGEGLGDVALADPDGPVEDDGLAGLQPAQGGEVADLGGGQLGEAVKSNPSRVASVSNRARRIRRARDMDWRREISSWHRTWRKSRWPSSPAWAWARRASRVASMPDSFRFAQRGGERAAVGDGDGGHGGFLLFDGGEDAAGARRMRPRALSQPRVRPGCGSGPARRRRGRPAGRPRLAGPPAPPMACGHLDDDLVRQG